MSRLLRDRIALQCDRMTTTNWRGTPRVEWLRAESFLEGLREALKLVEEDEELTSELLVEARNLIHDELVQRHDLGPARQQLSSLEDRISHTLDLSACTDTE